MALALAAPTAAREPMLRTAAASGRHVVVTMAPGTLVPGEMAVATKAARAPGGELVRGNVKLRERITTRADPATGIVRFRTARTLRRGAYYVAVSGFQQEPPTSCFPIASHCSERWSNIVRVVMPPPP
jgi:hypothetical protein